MSSRAAPTAFQRAITPVLDAMQIVPAFAYLMPVVILFSVGPGAAVVTTMIYAIPPAIRITALGIRGVPTNTVEAAEALGSTRKQVLWKVQLPLARRMLLLSVNQVILFALSMVVIAGLIGGPGLGDVVTNGIYSNPALAILAGFAIVIMAIALDRATESMAVRTDPAHRHVTDAVRRRLHLETLAAAAAVLVSVGLAYAFGAGAVYAGRNAQTWLLAQIQSFLDYVQDPATAVFAVSRADRQLHGEVRPHADGELLRRDPVARDAARVDGDRVPRERATAGYHNVLDARLNRSDRAVGSGDGDCGAGSRRDRSRGGPRVRPRRVGGREPHRGEDPPPDHGRAADAAAARLHHPVHLPDAGLDRAGDHRRGAVLDAGRDPARVDAACARSRRTPSRPLVPSARRRLQVLRKVKIPLARDAIMLGVNQGIIMVLAVVVIGGLVGSGGLGYEVAQGLQRNEFGLGVVASVAILALGIALDRVTQGNRRTVQGQDS